MVGVLIDVPASLRKARTAAGEGAWLDSLPELVDEMASHWSLTIGRSCDGFGMNAFVVEVTTSDGTATVLKIAPPSDANKIGLEATVLRLADGHGCVRLIDADIARRAILLERLGPSMYDLDIPRPAAPRAPARRRPADVATRRSERPPADRRGAGDVDDGSPRAGVGAERPGVF